MDEIVKQAMIKWPQVPHCHGWLGLDARGSWWLRDEGAQALGGFASGVAGAKGSLLEHEKLIAFIQRNYEADAQGCWFFQNGPQRVYVELEAAPWVWRLSADGAGAAQPHSLDGRAATVRQVLLDEQGRVFLATDRGLGLVHTQDMGVAAEEVEAGRWVPEPVRFADLPARFGYVLSPQAAEAARAG